MSYKEAVRFHGHNGPFLALGYRMGKEAMRILKPEGIMDIKVNAYLRCEKPYTCILDGLQCSTLTTLGKGNISFKPGKGVRVYFKNRKTGKGIEFRVKEGMIKRILKSEDLDRDASLILKEEEDKLWEITPRS